MTDQRRSAETGMLDDAGDIERKSRGVIFGPIAAIARWDMS
jgi:hypothetical protein